MFLLIQSIPEINMPKLVPIPPIVLEWGRVGVTINFFTDTLSFRYRWHVQVPLFTPVKCPFNGTLYSW